MALKKKKTGKGQRGCLALPSVQALGWKWGVGGGVRQIRGEHEEG